MEATDGGRGPAARAFHVATGAVARGAAALAEATGALAELDTLALALV